MAKKPNRIGHSPQTDGLKYGYRRLSYNVQVAASVYALLQAEVGDDEEYAGREAAKICGLIMARNFDDFFFVLPTKHDRDLKVDDLHVKDYNLTWKPEPRAQLSEMVRDRINTIAGHIVSSKPKVFHDAEARDVVWQTIPNTIDFLNACVREAKFDRLGTSEKYKRRLNRILEKVNKSSLRML